MRPKAPFTRLYGGSLLVGLAGLGLLVLAACMLIFRDQADTILPYLVRRGRTYGPGYFIFYLCLVAVLGVGLAGLAAWGLWAVPRSEARLDRHLSGQIDDVAERNTRRLD